VDDLDVRSVEVEFMQLDRGRCRCPLTESWPVAFEDVPPVRGFGWSRGQGHFPGWWWSATTGRHVGVESWLERDHVMCLDFERDVVGFASQPFWLHCRPLRAGGGTLRTSSLGWRIGADSVDAGVFADGTDRARQTYRALPGIADRKPEMPGGQRPPRAIALTCPR
jgi:hypothetical protein